MLYNNDHFGVADLIAINTKWKYIHIFGFFLSMLLYITLTTKRKKLGQQGFYNNAMRARMGTFTQWPMKPLTLLCWCRGL